MEGTKETAALEQYLTFYLAGEEYAISILRVKEILEYGVVTRVPKMPPWIRGVINLRGNVVPVVDLAVKFGVGENPVTKLTCVVILELELNGEPLVMGVIADSVNQVVDLTADDVEPPPAFGTHVRVDYLLGMAKMGKKFALILDIDKVLLADEILTATTSVPEPLTDPGTVPPPAEAAAGDEVRAE